MVADGVGVGSDEGGKAMRRYYISPIIGTGTEEDPFRPKLADKGKPWVAIIPSKPDGTPLLPWALCLVNALDHTPVTGDATIDALPDITLDSQLSVLATNVRNLVINKLTQRGIDMTGINATSTFRQVLERIGRFGEAAFSTDRFDVSGE